MLENNHKDLTNKVKEALAEFLGVEPEDISTDDSLAYDLQMKASDLTDFVETLHIKGFDTSDISLSEIETVSDLIETIGDKNI